MLQGGPLPSYVGANASNQQGSDPDARAGAIRAYGAGDCRGLITGQDAHGVTPGCVAYA
jgi:hypothetical protein